MNPPPPLTHDQTDLEATQKNERELVGRIAKESLFRFFKFISDKNLAADGIAAKIMATGFGKNKDIGSNAFLRLWATNLPTIKKSIEWKRNSTTQGLKRQVLGE